MFVTTWENEKNGQLVVTVQVSTVHSPGSTSVHTLSYACMKANSSSPGKTGKVCEGFGEPSALFPV